ncbi:Hypothetical protein PENO1_085300 [Penicillium occitanis (nom. inval.)]|nr:Hypothetical protein PENO1_085300 [Penicillium occitanis (nom. inval.)]PCG93322.1 hypothetical protein PENOC_088270 [Penicillium occitanis (nom. inval.)]
MADTSQDDQNTSPATDKIHDENTAGPTETIKVAVVHNNLAAVERILETSPVVLEARFDYTLPGDKNITRGLDPLMLAAALGRLRITKLLLMKGSDFFAETDGGLNSFFLATSRGNVEVAQIILQEGGATLLESRNKKGETPLLAVTRNGAVNTITFLIERGANMTARNRDYDTAIHIASRSGHFDVVQMIYDAIGTNMLELEGHRLQTPLLAAAANSKFEIIKFLLRKGASIMARDLFDNTVLHHASMSKSIDLVERLLKYEPSLLDEQNTRGKSALLIAAEKGDFDIVKFLLGEGADIMTRDRSRRTALHVATMNKSIEIVKLLLKREPNLLDLHDMFEQTALLIAAEKGHVEIIRHLHSRGAEIEAADSTGVTALLAAACFGHFPVVKYLIEAGADPTKTTSHGMNALHLITCFSHSAEVIDILLDGPANILKTAIAAKDDSGDTPLCYAISRNHAPTIWKLLESKVYFPLSPAQDEVHLSPYPESDKVYEWLLKWLEVDDEQGEIVEAVESLVDEHSETSVDKEFYHTKSHTNGIIYWALLNNREKLIELAMKKGQNPTFNQEGDRKGVTWLHVAALGGHVGPLEHLPDWQDDILAEANKKTTPLHLAAKQGNYDMVWKLLESLEGESLRTKASSTTGRQRMLQAITEGTDEEETLISLAAARKDSREHARLERSLWDKLFTIIENDEEFFELPHSDEAELIMGVAAWRHTTGEKEHLFRIMDLIHRGGECRHFHQSPLQFIVCHKFPVALWWLLSSGGYSGENHIREGELMMKTWEQQPGTEDSVHRLIEELLRNPPPVRPSLRDDNRPPRFQFERPNSDSQKGTVLNLFVTTKRQIIFELKRASMIDVIYDKGPEEIMATDGYGHFQAFKKRLTYLKQDQNNQQSKPEGPDEELRQKIVEEKPCNVVTGPEGESKKEPGEEDTFEPVSRERKSRFRWIHIPVNNELMVRISQEKKRDNGYHRHLADFMQKSRSELPAGGRNHYMKPDCQMPYLFWGQEPRDTNIEDSSNEESLRLKTSLQESQNASYENITSNMYNTIITSTTEEPDDVTDTFLQRVLNNLQAQNGKTVSSITDVAEYIIATATSLFNAQDIEIDNSDDAIDQKAVYERWKSVSGMEDYRHLGPSETKEDIEDMIEDAKSVQSAINTLLDLKQKEATIVEAQAARRQSDAVMVFTTVTIIFVSPSY